MIVYVLTNTVNNRQYVGKTSGSLKSRWSEHVYEANQGSRRLLCNAIRKYGTAAFTQQVIATAKTEKELTDLEIFYIKELKTFHSEGGYNLTLGGEGVTGHKHSAETKKLMSVRRKGYIQRPETIARRVVILKGQKRTPETKAKIASSHLGKIANATTKEKMRSAAKERWVRIRAGFDPWPFKKRSLIV